MISRDDVIVRNVRLRTFYDWTYFHDFFLSLRHWRLQIHMLKFHALGNTNVTNARTCEVGGWSSAITLLLMILRDDVIIHNVSIQPEETIIPT
jgi:hypothetical protein